MNERIKELAQQSGAYFGAASKDYFGEEYPAFVSTGRMDIEKFAELILKECMDICDSTQAQYGQYTFTATTVKNRIKEQFGVEE